MSARTFTYDDLVTFARSRGGDCLSATYEGLYVAHAWRCARGHAFEATLVLLIDGGYWCPTCFPSVADTSGWDYESLAEDDPLLRRFLF